MADHPSRRRKRTAGKKLPRSRPTRRQHVFLRRRMPSPPSRNRIPLPSARACSAWNRHLASGRCGTHTKTLVVRVVVVDGAIVVHDTRVVIVVIVARAQPPAPRQPLTTLSLYVIRPEGAYNPNRFRSLTIHAPSRLRQSYTLRVICSYCLGRMHCCSMASWAM